MGRGKGGFCAGGHGGLEGQPALSQAQQERQDDRKRRWDG